MKRYAVCLILEKVNFGEWFNEQVTTLSLINALSKEDAIQKEFQNYKKKDNSYRLKEGMAMEV